MVGLTSFTCVFYIHGATSFWGLPVPPGGRRLPLQELVFSRPLTLALVPLVLQGLLPRHNQNPLVKGTVLRRDPRPRDGEHLVPGPSRLSPPWRCGQRGLPGIPGSQTNIPQEDGGDLLSGPTVTSLHTSKKDSKNLVSLDDAGAIPAGSVGQGSPACEQLVHIITGAYPVLLSTQQAWGNSPVASPAPTPWQTACHLNMALPGLGGCT